MKRLDLEVIGSLFWMAVGIFFALGAVKLKLGTFRNPGPGFIPLGMSLLLLSFSLFNLTKGLINPARYASGIPWKRPALVVASVLFYMLLLGRLGFLPSTFILMAILFGLLIRVKRSQWPRVLFYAAATALCAWLVFSIFLRVPFP